MENSSLLHSPCKDHNSFSPSLAWITIAPFYCSPYLQSTFFTVDIRISLKCQLELTTLFNIFLALPEKLYSITHRPPSFGPCSSLHTLHLPLLYIHSMLKLHWTTIVALMYSFFMFLFLCICCSRCLKSFTYNLFNSFIIWMFLPDSFPWYNSILVWI